MKIQSPYVDEKLVEFIRHEYEKILFTKGPLKPADYYVVEGDEFIDRDAPIAHEFHLSIEEEGQGGYWDEQCVGNLEELFHQFCSEHGPEYDEDKYD